MKSTTSSSSSRNTLRAYADAASETVYRGDHVLLEMVREDRRRMGLATMVFDLDSRHCLTAFSTGVILKGLIDAVRHNVDRIANLAQIHIWRC